MNADHTPRDDQGQIPADDWTDQDLLTWSQARERLLGEIARIEQVISALKREQPGSPELVGHWARLGALRASAHAGEQR